MMLCFLFFRIDEMIYVKKFLKDKVLFFVKYLLVVYLSIWKLYCLKKEVRVVLFFLVLYGYVVICCCKSVLVKNYFIYYLFK